MVPPTVVTQGQLEIVSLDWGVRREAGRLWGRGGSLETEEDILIWNALCLWVLERTHLAGN